MLIYIIAINIACFFIMCYDKAMARAHKYRVPEIRLLLLAAAGEGAYRLWINAESDTLH